MFENITYKDDRWFDVSDLSNEEWRDIEDYEGIYQVSNYGRVKRLAHAKVYGGSRHHYDAMILKPQFDKYGYVRARLCKNQKKYNRMAHVLVAKAFIPNPNNYQDVNHKNGNKQCNMLYNLEWMPHSVNIKHSYYAGLNSHLKYNSISQYDLNGNLIATYENVPLAAQKTGINRITIYAALKGRQKTCHGFIWKINKDA